MAVAADARSFAETLEPRLVEVRQELLREARQLLGEFERHRDAETRGRLLQSLYVLTLLVRAERAEP